MVSRSIRALLIEGPRCLRCFNTIAAMALTIWCASAGAQTATNYDALIQHGKSQLDDNAERAAAAGKAAIKVSAERWEGYALVGGALMNLRRYEAAADTLSEAIKRAPESKQPALRDLRRQCLLAESGSPAVANTLAPASTTSQAEIVLWKSIENSANPADFQSYLDQYPRGTFVVLARRHLAAEEEGRIWPSIRNGSAYELQSYLDRYPNGGHAEEARALLVGKRVVEMRIDMREKVWSDPNTRMMWARPEYIYPNIYESHLDFYSAKALCHGLTLLGFSNWHLPIAEEIVALAPHRDVRLNKTTFGAAPFVAPSNVGFWTTTQGDAKGAHIMIYEGTSSSVDDRSYVGVTGGDQWDGYAFCVRESE
jgi:hypothetical protein